MRASINAVLRGKALACLHAPNPPCPASSRACPTFILIQLLCCRSPAEVEGIGASAEAYSGRVALGTPWARALKYGTHLRRHCTEGLWQLLWAIGECAVGKRPIRTGRALSAGPASA